MPRRRGGRGMMGASIAGILNADARNDQQAKRRVGTVFGVLLMMLFALDIACAFIVVYLGCSSGDGVEEDEGNDAFTNNISNNNTVTRQECVTHSIGQGFRCMTATTPFHHHQRHGDHHSNNTKGDFFAMAVLRCVIVTGLLLLGLQFGGAYHQGGGRISDNDTSRPETAQEQALTTATTTTTDNATTAGGLTEPLLQQQDNTDRVQAQPQTESNHDDDGREDQVNHSTTPSSGCCRKHQCHGLLQLDPEKAKNAVLLVLFVATTFFQVYAGLRVSTMDHYHFLNHDKMIMIPLLCLTVFWINAQAYVFRTLLAELVRPQALYLPPEVHRHPMYLETSRNISVHWCDLCHQPISSSPSSSSGGQQQGQGQSVSCYRCGMCDFDCCLKCAQRNDAATVGENVLRGDRGVRVETSLTTASYFHRSMQVARAELPLLVVSFLLLAATSMSQLLLPHFQGRIIDKVIPDPATSQYDKDGFFYFIRIYIGIMVAQGAISTIYSAILTLVSRRLKFTLRNALLEKILAQDVAYFDGTESGRLISRLTNDLDLMMSPIQSSLSSLLQNILILFGGMIMCFAKSYRLSMLAFVTVGPISYLWEQYAHWSKGLAREMLSFWAEGNSIASQALSHVRTVKAFGCEDKVLKKYSDSNQQALHCGVKDAWGNALTSALTGYLDLGSGVLILYYGGLLVYKGELTVGELVTFQLFWNMMNNSFQSLQGLITNFTRSAAGAEKVFSMWDCDPDIDPKSGVDVDWEVNGHLQLQNVKFFYQMRPDNIVLKEFNLDIPAGKTLALVGRSGGGKSTLVNLLLRFYDPKEGKIVLDGRDYESLKVNQLRKCFGVVTQETELFALTVEENIAYGLDKDEYTMEDVIDAAKKAFAHDFICEMKDGYQTRIGERGNRLSGGQRQRLAIARVFLRRPKIILLDEATSALDENSQEAVQQALANLIAESNATVVLVAHRLSTVVNADSICVIDKGSVLEQGNHDELVAKGGIYASMVEKQLKKRADTLAQDQKKIEGDKRNAEGADDIDALLDEK